MPNDELQDQAIKTLRFLSVDMVEKANSGHPGLPMGCAAIAYTVWTRHLRFNPQDPLRPVGWPRQRPAVFPAVPDRPRPGPG